MLSAAASSRNSQHDLAEALFAFSVLVNKKASLQLSSMALLFGYICMILLWLKAFYEGGPSMQTLATLHCIEAWQSLMSLNARHGPQE